MNPVKSNIKSLSHLLVYLNKPNPNPVKVINPKEKESLMKLYNQKEYTALLQYYEKQKTADLLYLKTLFAVQNFEKLQFIYSQIDNPKTEEFKYFIQTLLYKKELGKALFYVKNFERRNQINLDLFIEKIFIRGLDTNQFLVLNQIKKTYKLKKELLQSYFVKSRWKNLDISLELYKDLENINGLDDVYMLPALLDYHQNDFKKWIEIWKKMQELKISPWISTLDKMIKQVNDMEEDGDLEIYAKIHLDYVKPMDTIELFKDLHNSFDYSLV